MPLNERDRIEILMMIGVGDRMRTQQEVCRLFHEMHPDREPVSQSTVSRIERKYRELGHVRDAPRQGRPKINENVQQDVILSALENPHCTVRQVSRDLNIGKSSVSNIFKKVKYHPYRVRLIHELAEDDFDRRTEFCEYMMDHNNQNNGFIANILFSDEATFFLNGHVNRQNTRYWSQENPHWMQEYHTQHPQKIFLSHKERNGEAVKFGRMSKKQREKVEDEVRFHRAQLRAQSDPDSSVFEQQTPSSSDQLHHSYNGGNRARRLIIDSCFTRDGSRIPLLVRSEMLKRSYLIHVMVIVVAQLVINGCILNFRLAASLALIPSEYYLATLVSVRGAGVDTRNTKKRHDDHASVQYEKANAYCYCLPLHN
ncbi:hypothetical protein NQ318_008580 [Aromia moschata]|uniref:Uncharacterized protein n=1 Tax=Aromia moschata TaxID=1265417 RepID=A0AAV8YXH8_9CUCU|nr:hypothetical protein NQ318_008580 [Aromia moschata]